MLKVGDIVVVLGAQDSRVRDKQKEGLVIGCIDQLLCDDQVSVLLDGGDIWTGQLKQVVLASEQE